MTKRENPRRREKEFNKFQERNNRSFRKKDDNQMFKKEGRTLSAKETDIDAVREDLILGRNAVIEALKSDRTIECLYVSKGDLEGSIKVALGLAKDKGVVVKEADRRKLDVMCEGLNHQGIVAKVTPFKYCEVSDILEVAERKNEKPFIVILDEIEDPHNLGSIIRTAELCGVHGIIIPKRRNVGVTSTVYKCSAGAIEHMKIAKVTNINATIDILKEKGIWIYGADIEGKDFSYNTDVSGACALIIGSEGKGISSLTLKKCDLLVKIPMIGKINSLNASVATAVLLYQIHSHRFPV